MQTGRGWREGRAEDTIAFKRHFIGTFMIEHQYCKQKGDLLGKNYRVHLYWSLKGSAAYPFKANLILQVYCVLDYIMRWFENTGTAFLLDGTTSEDELQGYT